MFKFFGRKNDDSTAITQEPPLDFDEMPNQTPSSSAFKMPSAPDSGPLQQLSPERVHNAGRLTSISTTTTQKSTVTSETEDFDLQSSPTRRAKANLFGDYSPNKHTPTDPKVMGFALPQSPSLPEIHALRSHVRTSSDVQGLVKRFEHLDVRDRDAESQERRKRHEAELRRAQIAREEAESDVKRLREEVRRLKKEGDEGRERERKVGRRLEVLQEELLTANSSHHSQSSVYEKEMKKARKEAFKSSSQVLKLQEELKSTRNTLRITQQGFNFEKQKVNRKEQERFEMEYQLIPLQEAVEQLKQKLKVAEEEREALKTNLKEEEVARIAAEGMIALPVSESMDLDFMSSPRKVSSPQKTRGMFDTLEEDKENMGAMSKKASETRRLALDHERMRREHAEEMIDFLRMECQFRCCGCRGASRSGHQLALELDAELATAIDRIRAGMQHILTPSRNFDEGYGTQEDGYQSTAAPVVSQGEDSQPAALPQQTESAPVDTPMLDDSDGNQVSRSATPANDRSPGDQLLDEEEDWLSNSPPKDDQPPSQPQEPEPEAAVDVIDFRPSTPSQPQPSPSPTRNHPSIRTVTTTTTVPMQFTPISKPLKPYSAPAGAPFTAPADPDCAILDAENIPPIPSTAAKLEGVGLEGVSLSFDREAALKMIEYRRGRAKSIANGTATPRKQMLEGVGGRRDISAPALGQQGVGGGNGSVGRPVGGSARRRK